MTLSFMSRRIHWSFCMKSSCDMPSGVQALAMAYITTRKVHVMHSR